MQEEEKSLGESESPQTPSEKEQSSNGSLDSGVQAVPEKGGSEEPVSDAVIEEQIKSSFLPEEDGEGGADNKTESAAAAANRIRQEREEKEQKEEQAKKLNLLARIQRMDVGERAKLARSGDSACRSILVKDSSKQVALSVLINPKITTQEIEQIAASRNVHEDLLREIGSNKDWCKNYSVILALVNNPKTPIPISLTFLPKLLTRDLRFVAKSKGVPEAIRNTAKRLDMRRTLSQN